MQFYDLERLVDNLQIPDRLVVERDWFEILSSCDGGCVVSDGGRASVHANRSKRRNAANL